LSFSDLRLRRSDLWAAREPRGLLDIDERCAFGDSRGSVSSTNELGAATPPSENQAAVPGEYDVQEPFAFFETTAPVYGPVTCQAVYSVTPQLVVLYSRA
jgi:hypothetical protein